MTATSKLTCMTAAMLCLMLGNAQAADPAEPPEKPEAAGVQENSSPTNQSQEEANQKSTTQSKTSKTKEEPDCD